jgi:hypothetical protein
VFGTVDQTDEVKGVESPAPSVTRCHSRDEQGQLDVLDGGQHRHQVVELKDEAHALRAVAGAFSVRQTCEADAVDPNLAGGDVVQSGQAVEKGGLSAAARTHDGHHLAAIQTEIHTLQGVHLDLPGVICLPDTGGADDDIAGGVRYR